MTAAEADSPAMDAARVAGLDYEVVVTERAFSVEDAADKQGLAVSNLIKTLVVRLGEDDYLFVLVPGDRAIDWPRLRAHLGVHRVALPDADEARAATGYERGTITPFGSSTAWPVLADASIPGSGIISLGAGRHGVSLHADAAAALEALDADVAAITKER